jgi:hypothetical protein
MKTDGTHHLDLLDKEERGEIDEDQRSEETHDRKRLCPL